MTDLTTQVVALATAAVDAAKIEKDNGTRALHLSQAALNVGNAHRVLFDMRVPDTNKAAG